MWEKKYGFQVLVKKRTELGLKIKKKKKESGLTLSLRKFEVA